MNIYVVTRVDIEINAQLPPVGAATTMKGALYLLYKELNKDSKTELYSIEEIEKLVDRNSMICNGIDYNIFKTECEAL